MKAIAVDFGGTKVLTSLVDENLVVLDSLKMETRSGSDTNEIVRRLNYSINALLRKNGISIRNLAGIGLAIPGVIHGNKVTLTNVNMEDFDLKSAVSKDFDTNIIVENDVTAGLWGEYAIGIGNGYTNLLGVYIGTGIGGGAIINRKLYKGIGSSTEFGHMVIMPDGPLCSCGNRGCLESICSRNAIAKELIGLGLKGKSETIYNLAGGDITKIKSKVILEAVNKKEKDVIEVLKRSAYYLGIAISNLTFAFNPEIVIIGGGIIEKLKENFYFETIKKSAHENIKLNIKKPEIKVAQLGSNSAIIGIADLVFESKSSF